MMALVALSVGNTMVKSPLGEDLSEPNASTTQETLAAFEI